MQQMEYPVRFSVDYPDRPLDAPPWAPAGCCSSGRYR